MDDFGLSRVISPIKPTSALFDKIIKWIFSSEGLGRIPFIWFTKWWQIILIMAGAFFLNYYLILKDNPKYISEAKILISQDYDLNDVKTLIEQIASDNMGLTVIKQLNLQYDDFLVLADKNYTQLTRQQKLNGTLREYKKNLSFKHIPDTRVVEVSFKHSNPRTAQKITEAILEMFIFLELNQNSDKKENLKNSILFAHETLDKIETDIEKKLKNIEYEYLLQQYSTALKNEYLASFEILSTARDTPPVIVKNDFRKNINILFASFLIATAILFIIDFFDNKISNLKDISKYLKIDSIGITPSIKIQNSLKDHLINPESKLAEAYASLRTQFQFSAPNGGPCLIQITSTVAGEGKSTTALGLGVKLASNSKTLIIDADMRLPNYNSKIGLSTLLSSKDPISNAIVKTHIDNLYMLSSGPIPPNPAELLSSERFDEILAYAAEKFRYVLIDSPPVLSLADAPTIGAKAEVTLFVVEANRERAPSISFSIKRLKDSGAKVLRVVLTKYPVKSRPHYAYHEPNNPYSDKTSQNIEKRKPFVKKKINIT